jgi:hypothetical protein
MFAPVGLVEQWPSGAEPSGDAAPGGHCLSPVLVSAAFFLNSHGVNHPSLECGRRSL